MAHVLNPPAAIRPTTLGRMDRLPVTDDNVKVTATAQRSDIWAALRRYLVIGGVDVALARSLPVTSDDAAAVHSALAEDSLRVVAEILAATAARPTRPEPLLLALALAAAADDDLTRRAALSALPRVARTSRDLFLFATFVQRLRGWGRGLRRAVGAWYNDRSPADLIEDVLATSVHAGWRHADLLRLGHPKAPTLTHDAIYRWAVTGAEPRLAGTDPAEPRSAELLARLAAASAIVDLRDVSVAAGLIALHRLPLASVPGRLRHEPLVWQALLPHLSIAELLASLPDLAALNCLVPGSPAHGLVCGRLGNPTGSSREQPPPLAVVSALRVYEAGHSPAGRWAVNDGIRSSLSRAFDESCRRLDCGSLPLRLRIPADIAQRQGFNGTLSALDVAATVAVVLSRAGVDIRIEVQGAATLPLRLAPGATVDEAAAAIGRLATRAGSDSGESSAITLSGMVDDTQRVIRFGTPEPEAGPGAADDLETDRITVLGVDPDLIATILALMRPAS